jgi:hypothetical protein
MTKKITVSYFPKGMKFTTPCLTGAGIYLFTLQHPVWGSILILLSAIILTTHYHTTIDLSNRKIRDYISLLGIPLQEEIKTFKQPDRIIVTKGNYSQTLNTRIQSRQMNWSDYTATLMLDNGDTLDLLTCTSKKELMTGLNEFVDFLQVDIEDRTIPR